MGILSKNREDGAIRAGHSSSILAKMFGSGIKKTAASELGDASYFKKSYPGEIGTGLASGLGKNKKPDSETTQVGTKHEKRDVKFVPVGKMAGTWTSNIRTADKYETIKHKVEQSERKSHPEWSEKKVEQVGGATANKMKRENAPSELKGASDSSETVRYAQVTAEEMTGGKEDLVKFCEHCGNRLKQAYNKKQPECIEDAKEAKGTNKLEKITPPILSPGQMAEVGKIRITKQLVLPFNERIASRFQSIGTGLFRKVYSDGTSAIWEAYEDDDGKKYIAKKVSEGVKNGN